MVSLLTKLTLSRKHQLVAQTPFHIPDSISHSNVANFYKAIDVLLIFFSKRRQYFSIININTCLMFVV